MESTDPEFMDERVAELDDKLNELLAEMEATCIQWAVEVVRRREPAAEPEET